MAAWEAASKFDHHPITLVIGIVSGTARRSAYYPSSFGEYDVVTPTRRAILSCCSRSNDQLLSLRSSVDCLNVIEIVLETKYQLLWDCFVEWL